MELVMGQYTGKGPTKCWEMNPAAKGIGISMCMVSLVVSIYYNIIVAYTIYYLFSSMQATLPWTQCKPVSVLKGSCLVVCKSGTTYKFCLLMSRCVVTVRYDCLLMRRSVVIVQYVCLLVESKGPTSSIFKVKDSVYDVTAC